MKRMHVLLIGLGLGLGLMSHSAKAGEYLCGYWARIGHQDKENSQGASLIKEGANPHTVAMILRQDRANYYVYEDRDPEDQADCAMDQKDNRERMETMLSKGVMSKVAQFKITHEHPLVYVKIYTDRVDVRIHTEEPEETGEFIRPSRVR